MRSNFLVAELNQSPTFGASVAQVCNIARIDMKRAVSIKMNSRDATENSEDRKVMTYHNYCSIGSLALDDSIHSFPGPSCHINQSLATGDKEVGRRLPPLLDEIREGNLDVRKRQSFEFAMVEFTKTVVYGNCQPVRSADDTGRLYGPFQIA